MEKSDCQDRPGGALEYRKLDGLSEGGLGILSIFDTWCDTRLICLMLLPHAFVIL